MFGCRIAWKGRGSCCTRHWSSGRPSERWSAVFFYHSVLFCTPRMNAVEYAEERSLYVPASLRSYIFEDTGYFRTKLTTSLRFSFVAGVSYCTESSERRSHTSKVYLPPARQWQPGHLDLVKISPRYCITSRSYTPLVLLTPSHSEHCRYLTCQGTSTGSTPPVRGHRLDAMVGLLVGRGAAHAAAGGGYPCDSQDHQPRQASATRLLCCAV